MKMFNRIIILSIAVVSFFIVGCSSKKTISMDSYSYDTQFLSQNDVEYIELYSEDGESRVMIVPDWQGRVMTSTASGLSGDSFGWLNYKLIESGEVSSQFNPVGGEERFWFGPEGGPFSLYFKKGDEQVYENWKVPAVIDTEPFSLVMKQNNKAVFSKKTSLVNASDYKFDIGIERQISLLSFSEIERSFDIELGEDMKAVCYRTDNTIKNEGEEAWSQSTGLVSIWLLCMFTPTPTTTVVIPYNSDAEGRIVNDEYFGKVPADRLIVEDGNLFFKIDGEYRSKIGIPGARAKEICGSYDSSKSVLTLVWCSLPDSEDAIYVNGQWGEQDNPYAGDAINAYNDGPVEDGSIMGPFYEIESSSPGVELSPGEEINHSQIVAHIQASPDAIAPIVAKVFDLDLDEIIQKFK